MSDRKGDWMQTFTGQAFYPLDPRPEEVDPRDIAHALSMICRYGGHTNRFYSVAEHCVLMSYAVAPENALWALLHDATEAYVVDLIRPIKRFMPDYRVMEAGVALAICEHFGIPAECPAEVKEADSRILLDEREVMLSTPPQSWGSIEGVSPLGVSVAGWSPSEAEVEYWARLMDLTS